MCCLSILAVALMFWNMTANTALLATVLAAQQALVLAVDGNDDVATCALV